MVLVTGHKGFIGQALKFDYEGFDLKDGLDIRSLRDLSVMGDRKIIVNLAAISGVMPCYNDPLLALSTNVQGPVNIMKIATALKQRVILASSGAVKEANHPYAASKRAMEDFAEAYRKSYGLDVSCLRFTNVYGTGSIDKNSVIAQFCKDALTSGEIAVFGSGKQTRDFVYIEDVAEGIKQVLPKSHPVVQVIGGKQVEIGWVAEHIASLTGAKVTYQDARTGDVMSNHPDPCIPSLIGKTSLRNGIEKTLSYFGGVL